MHEAEFKLRNN